LRLGPMKKTTHTRVNGSRLHNYLHLSSRSKSWQKESKMIRIEKPKPVTRWAKIKAWFMGLIPFRRESLTIIMPSGREMRVIIDDDMVEVDLGKAEQYGVEESFKAVGDELRRSFEQVRKELEQKEKASHEDLQQNHKS